VSDEVSIRLLGAADASVLEHVAPGLFEGPIQALRVREFFDDPRHHLVVALDGGVVVGFVTGIHYVHLDGPPELWVNGVAVAESHRQRGLARRMLDTLLAHARTLGCTEAWVSTEVENAAGRKLYASAGGGERPMLCVAFDLANFPRPDA
jgi:ribosomal protein S18 acetylase RimI-like enzyme